MSGNGVERLRNAIDRGETRDKLPFSDPAASPLGTDDEAAGRPPPAEAVQTALRQETRGRRTPSSGMSDESSRDPHRPDGTAAWPPPRIFLIMAAVAAGFVVAALVGGLGG